MDEKSCTIYVDSGVVLEVVQLPQSDQQFLKCKNSQKLNHLFLITTALILLFIWDNLCTVFTTIYMYLWQAFVIPSALHIVHLSVHPYLYQCYFVLITL